MESKKVVTKKKPATKKATKPKMPSSKQLNRVGTLDNIPGLGDDVKTMYRDLKRMDSITSIISDISEEGYDVGDLADRLHGVDLTDSDAIWAKLSESERENVGKIVQTQNMNAVLPVFSPWWENKVHCIEIEEVGSSSGGGGGSDQCKTVSTEHKWRDLKHPKIKNTIAEFSQISCTPPGTHIENNLKNVLAAYTSTVRMFYGEHLRSACDALKYIYAICSSFKSNEIFFDSQLAIEAVRQEARKEGLSFDACDVQQIEKDIQNITEGPDPHHRTNCYILAALSDLYRLIQLAKSRSSLRSLQTKTTGSSKKSMQIIPAADQVRATESFINRFADLKIVEFISMEKSQIVSIQETVEYFLAYAKKFLSFS